MVWPFGCVCHAVRAPGVKWTLLALTREAPFGAAKGSTYTAPVNHSLEPLVVPRMFLVICMFPIPPYLHGRRDAAPHILQLAEPLTLRWLSRGSSRRLR